MTRLFVASGIFHPEPGGPATYLYELLPELQARGFEVRVLSYSDDKPTTHYPYPVTRILRRAFPIRLAHYALSSIAPLRWADLVYAHSVDLPLIGGNAPRIIKIVGDQAWERAIRKGWIPETEDIDDYQTKTYSATINLARESRAKQVQAMDGVIAPSEYLKRMVVGWGVDASKVEVIYNALPPDAKHESRTQSDARQSLGLPDAPTITTVARLTAWKGVNHLIEALKRIPDVHLLVAGDGPMQAQLQAQAELLGKRVTFLGRVGRDKLPLYIQAADYLALYSGYEGLSHTLLESLQLGTPLIASDKGGNPEVVQHGINGFLVPYVDVDSLTETIRDAFKVGKRAELAANSHIGMERFDFTNMVEKTAAALRGYTKK